MQVLHTAGVPPSSGRIILPTIGCDHEQERGAHEERERVEQQDGGHVRIPPVAASGRRAVAYRIISRARCSPSPPSVAGSGAELRRRHVRLPERQPHLDHRDLPEHLLRTTAFLDGAGGVRASPALRPLRAGGGPRLPSARGATRARPWRHAPRGVGERRCRRPAHRRSRYSSLPRLLPAAEVAAVKDRLRGRFWTLVRWTTAHERFRRCAGAGAGSARERGRATGGWPVQLFVTDFPADRVQTTR